MPKAKRPPIGEHAGRRECVSRLLRRGLLEPGEAGRKADGDVVTEDRDRLSHGARRGIEPRHQGAGETARAELGEVRHLLWGRFHALRSQSLSDLRNQERIPAGHGMARRGERAAWLAAELAREVAGRALRAKRMRSQHVDRRIGEQGSERILADRRPRRHEHGDRHPGQPHGKETQERDGLLVGPVRIVDNQQQRLDLGELGEQPVQPVEGALGRGGVAARRGWLQRGERERSSAGEQLLAAGQSSLQRLPDDAEREPPLELASARGKHPHAGGTGVRDGQFHERRLADSRLALDHQHATPTDTRLVEQELDTRNLRVPLDQPDGAHRHRRDHKRIGTARQPRGQSQGHHRRDATSSAETIDRMTTTTSTNTDTALRALALICDGDAGSAVDEVIHPDFVNHRPGSPRGGPNGFRDVIRWLGAAFAEISITPDDVIACGDKVVARTRFKALHVGPFNGIPPSNRTIEIDQIHIWRVQDGLVAENWACMDEVSGIRQMGAALPSRTDMSTTVTNVARTYSQAWANRDPDAIAALHTADSVFHLS